MKIKGALSGKYKGVAMKIYIEFVIIDNIVIDGLLLWLTNKTLKVSSNPVRIFLAAFLGTVGAIVFHL